MNVATKEAGGWAREQWMKLDEVTSPCVAAMAQQTQVLAHRLGSALVEVHSAEKVFVCLRHLIRVIVPLQKA